MIYFQATTLTEYKHTDVKRFTLTGYPGNIYKAVDTADYGGGVEHCTEWVEKYGYTIKTKAQAQELVNAGITTINNLLAGDELEGRPAIEQGGITLE
jgi:hypothetical protein|tara:strand:- start:1110 stop:1400 length:291 start_codon:yes stop_codon:yes gene_type:complete